MGIRPPTAAPGTWHHVLDHTSELMFRVRAPTWAELIAEAGRALGEALLREPSGAPSTVWRAVEVTAADRAALLVDWLNELLYRAEAEWWIPTEFAVDAASSTVIRARARGVAVTAPPAAVKAATLHGVKVVEVPGGLEASVILDV